MRTGFRIVAWLERSGIQEGGIVVLAQPLHRLAVGLVVEFAAIIQPSQVRERGAGDDAFDTCPCSLSVSADGARHSIDELHGR